MLLRFSAAIAVLFFGTEANADTLCVSPSRPSCHDTIQAAVDAAQPGDLIKIFPHPDPRGYRENVVITTADITLEGAEEDGGPEIPELKLAQGDGDGGKDKGKGGPQDETCPPQILDGCETPGFPESCSYETFGPEAYGINVNASDVTIRNLTLRHYIRAIASPEGGRSDSLRVENVCVFRSRAGVNVDGDQVRVLSSDFLGINGVAVRIEGIDGAIKDSRLINSDGIELHGDRHRVIGSLIALSNDHACVFVSGNDVLIEDSQFKACDDGLTYVGDGARIFSNTFEGFGNDGYAIEVNGHRAKVGGNVTRLLTERGVRIFGDSSRIFRNDVHIAGADDGEPGIEIRGSDNVIEQNTVTSATFAGIENETGSRNRYESNLMVSNGTSGIVIREGEENEVITNRSLNNHGEGIAILESAVNTRVIRNTSLGNRTDICNESPSTVHFGNRFETGGFSTPCVVEN